MNIAELSIKYKTITIVFVVLLVAGGMYSYQNLGRLEDPEFTIKDAQIFTFYPGASAEEVAEEVTDEIETAVQQLGQLDEVTSISEAGKSTVKITIKDNYDKSTLPQVWDEVRRKVSDAQTKLPPGTSTSIVFDDFGDVYGIYYAIYGDGYSYAELKEYAQLLRRELLLVHDVSKVTLSGVQEEVVYLEISRAKLSQLGLPPDAISNTLAGQNLVGSGGNVQIGSQYIRIQPTGELKSVDQIGELLLLQQDGSPSKLRLKDIAKIKRGYVDPPGMIMHYNGHPSIGLGISTVQGGNVVIMGDAIKERMRQLQSQTPIGMEVGAIAHQADAVTIAISSFIISLAEALAIVIGILMVAMGLRSGLLIGVILLLTVLGTFVVMLPKGIMLERISLGALIIALGMLVDNAIVVVEGILINMQKGMDKIKAASQIVSQTIWPLFGATIVAVLAFAAIGLSQDSTGEYCRSLFLVILISLMLSWVLAITVTPLLGVMFLKVSNKDSDKDPYGGALFKGYKAFLKFCLKSSKLTVILLVIMMVLSLYGFGHVKQSFFPPSTRPQFMVHYWLNQGTHITKTESDLSLIEKDILDFNGVTDIATFVGQGAMRFLLTYQPEEANDAYGLMLVSVDEYKKIEDLIPKIQQHIQDKFPDSQAFCRKFVLGPGDPSKIQARFRGPDSKVLRGLAKQAKDIMIAEPDATDVLDDWRQPVPLLRPIVAETQARNAGITRQQINDAITTAFEGVKVGDYREGDEILPIIMRSPEKERSDPDNINYIQIWSPVAQKSIPLSQVVTKIETKVENSIIRRKDRLATITAKCDPAVGEASDVLKKLMPKIESIELPEGYQLQWGGEYEDSGRAQASLAGKLPPIFLFMVVTVICLFNSIKKPAIIFLIVPLAIIGVTVGLLVTGQPFGFMALLGFLSLIGMLVKNAIVLIDEINIQIATGKDPFTAIVDSGVSRVRPVSMAALTTVLGMIPLLADAFFAAMAVTIMFGLTFATVLTLIVVPVLYASFFNIKPQ
jgi:multidrug efflux pump subunit AcrB